MGRHTAGTTLTIPLPGTGAPRLHLTQWGDPDAPVALWLHGAGPGNTGAQSWAGTVTRMPGWRHLVPDIPGFGDSPGPSPAPNGLAPWHRARVAALIGALDALAVDRFVVVGHSLGAMYAMSLLRDEPRCARGVLVDPGGTPTRMGPNIKPMIVYYGDPGPEAMRQVVAAQVLDPRREAAWIEEVVAQRLALADRPDIREAHEGTFSRSGEGMFFDGDALAGIGVPVLSVHGRGDQVIPPAATEFVVEHIPHARAAMIEDCGHWPQIEQPDRFLAVVGEFLGGAP